MDEREYTLEKISYSKKEDCRIIESVLNGWFQNPKTLNLVSPNLTYPFKFKNWVSKNYSTRQREVISFVLKTGKWIVGHISYYIEKNRFHIFHLIIDEKFRKLGLAKILIRKIEKDCFLKQKNYMTLNVLKKNEIAINLYKQLGFTIVSYKNLKCVKMKKHFNKV